DHQEFHGRGLAGFAQLAGYRIGQRRATGCGFGMETTARSDFGRTRGPGGSSAVILYKLLISRHISRPPQCGSFERMNTPDEFTVERDGKIMRAFDPPMSADAHPSKGPRP